MDDKETISYYLNILAGAVLKGEVEVKEQSMDVDGDMLDITFGVRVKVSTDDYNNISLI